MTATFESSGDDGKENKPDDEVFDLADAIITHDQKNTALLELTSDLIEHPDKLTDDTGRSINIKATAVVTSWKNVLNTLLSVEGSINDGFLNCAITVWLDDEKKRITLFNENIPDASFSAVQGGSWDKLNALVKEAVEVHSKQFNEHTLDAAVIQFLLSEYSDSLQMDLNQFITHIENAKYEKSLEKSPETTSTLQEKLKSLLPVLGAYAYDVSKLAAGVSIGIILGNAARGRRK